MENLNLTNLEQLAVSDMRQMYQGGNELIYIGDLQSVNPKQLRGVLSSLVKKGVIDVNKSDGGIITLFEEYR